MNKESFLREDYKTYKPKFKLCCNDCNTNNFVKKFGELELNNYISRIKITEK